MKWFVVGAMVLMPLIGCNDSKSRTVVVSGPSQAVTTAPTSIMDSSDLDLATIADLIRSGRVQDAETLQSTINDPQNALNNVDLDHDGNVDPITVSEVQNATGKQFNLVANPSNQPATTIANIDLTTTGTQVLVQAGYPSYVRGYQDSFYSYQAARDIAFFTWALSTRPYYVARPYTSYSWYAPHPIYAPSVVTQRRTTYTTQTHVSPVQRQAPPSTYTQKAQATKIPSGFKPSAPTPTTQNLNDRSVASDFRVRDTSQPVQKATGFGVKPSNPVAPAPSPVTKPSFSSPSRPTGPSFRSSSPSMPRPSTRR